MDSPRSPRRPALLGPAALATFAGGNDPAHLAEVAHATAVAVVTAGRSADDPAATDRLVRLMDEVGIDTVAELWADRPARSLPGALWRLYALREWVRVDAVEASCDYEAGQHLAQVARVVAGAGEPSTPQALRELLDAILGGVFRGDLAVALERAGAFARVVATGRARRADELEAADSAAAAGLTLRAAAMQRTAEDLDAAAALWRTADLV
ncbi:MAG: hypothetical protein QOJ90_567 [Actinomycetota bacterium]|jgi:hypothetical protein|nr:hypothetical protein [Actinomycetota bacterium]MDQ1641216.1 hypothetical protein [Actinomycetota bacterium]